MLWWVPRGSYAKKGSGRKEGHARSTTTPSCPESRRFCPTTRDMYDLRSEWETSSYSLLGRTRVIQGQATIPRSNTHAPNTDPVRRLRLFRSEREASCSLLRHSRHFREKEQHQSILTHPTILCGMYDFRSEWEMSYGLRFARHFRDKQQHQSNILLSRTSSAPHLQPPPHHHPKQPYVPGWRQDPAGPTPYTTSTMLPCARRIIRTA